MRKSAKCAAFCAVLVSCLAAGPALAGGGSGDAAHVAPTDTLLTLGGAEPLSERSLRQQRGTQLPAGMPTSPDAMRTGVILWDDLGPKPSPQPPNTPKRQGSVSTITVRY